MSNKLIFVLLACLLLSVSSYALGVRPNISEVEPINAEEIDDTQVNLIANISDADGDLRYIFVNLTTENNVFVGEWEKQFSENTSSYHLDIAWLGLEIDTKYFWNVCAKDYYGNWTNSTFHFFTPGNGNNSNNDDDNGYSGDGEISIIPKKPKAGKNVIFILDGSIDEKGYISCEESGNVYLVSVDDGLGQVELGMENGNATVVFPGYGSKDFSFGPPFEGDLQIDSPYDAELNQQIPISVYAAGEQISAKLTMVSPTEHEIIRTTNENSPINIEFGSAGNWTLKAEYYGTVKTKNLIVNPKPIEINLPDSVLSGDEMQIRVNTKATVTIEKDETSWTYESDDDGRVYFTPPWAGRYKLTAKSFNQEGSKFFSVKSDTQIIIKNDQGRTVNSISKDEVILVQVVDSQGNQISKGMVTIIADGSPIKQLDLTGGSTIWKVTEDATQYEFNFASDDSSLLSTSAVVEGEIEYNSGYDPQPNPTSQEGDGGMTYVVIFVIIIAIIMALYYLHTQGYIDISMILPNKSSDLIEEDELF